MDHPRSDPAGQLQATVGSTCGEVSFNWSDLDQAFSVMDTGVVPGGVPSSKNSHVVLDCRELRRYRKIDSQEWEEDCSAPFTSRNLRAAGM